MKYYLDTCYIIWVVEHHHNIPANAYITSFNLEELHHVAKKHHLHHQLVKFAKTLPVINVPVSPGDIEGEIAFVKQYLPDLHESDHSDAVLLAAAVRDNAAVLTRDKHDLFNQYIKEHVDIPVLKSFENTQ